MSQLRVENVAIIESLCIEFAPGLNLLTGETGAGKSIIVDALGLLVGGKAHPEDIRSGAEQAVVEAEFICDPGDAALSTALPKYDVVPDENRRLILRRELTEKRSRAFVQGRAVPVSTLREIGLILVNIHGQHEHQALFDPASHVALLDAFAGHSEICAEVSSLAGRGLAAVERLAAIDRQTADLARRRDFLQFQIDEIRAAGLAVGEEEVLRGEKHRLLNAEKITGLATSAVEAMYAGDGAAEDQLAKARRSLEELARILPEAAGPAGRLTEVAEHLREVSRDIQAIAASAEPDPARLEAVENRLYTIEKLKKKYGADIQGILRSLGEAEQELAGLGRLELDREEAEGELQAARRAYEAAAAALSERRKEAADRLRKSLLRQLSDLAMAATRFEVRLAPLARSAFAATGLETAEFFLSPNPGEPLKPLAAIASGGELSRIMLALKCSAVGDTGAQTLVFDEIDAGIGGGTAEVLGRKLSSVADRQQVLCVTHLPQITAFADCHIAVSKSMRGGRTVTQVRRLDAGERAHEIARMMGGAEPTQVALRHAQELLRRAADSRRDAVTR
ncbi:MAG: DNA repair protein RecN [Acidobacteriota bacterium]